MYKSKGIVADNSVTKFKYAPKESFSKQGRPRKIFPHNWVTGPDMLRHEMYYAWQKHRAQARYRNEPYDLTFEDWEIIWANTNDFLSRGRKPEDLTLTRLDLDGAWTLDNCIIITRLEQLRRAMANKMAKMGKRPDR